MSEQPDPEPFSPPACEIIEVGMPRVDTEFISASGHTESYPALQRELAERLISSVLASLGDLAVEARLHRPPSRLGSALQTREQLLRSWLHQEAASDYVAFRTFPSWDEGAFTILSRRSPSPNITGGLVTRSERQRLEARIAFLEAHVQAQRVDLRLYRIGAALFVTSVASLASWWLLGVAAPFHEIFALMALPTSIGAMVMAFLWRAKK